MGDEIFDIGELQIIKEVIITEVKISIN